MSKSEYYPEKFVNRKRLSTIHGMQANCIGYFNDRFFKLSEIMKKINDLNTNILDDILNQDLKQNLDAAYSIQNAILKQCPKSVEIDINQIYNILRASNPAKYTYKDISRLTTLSTTRIQYLVSKYMDVTKTYSCNTVYISF